LNPLVTTDSQFNVTEEYPRAYETDYHRDLKAKKRSPAVVVEADFELESGERAALEKDFGAGIFPAAPEVRLSKGYDNKHLSRRHDPDATRCDDAVRSAPSRLATTCNDGQNRRAKATTEGRSAEWKT